MRPKFYRIGSLQVVFTTWLHFLLWSLWQAAYDLLCSGWCPSRLLQRRKTKFCTCVYDKCGKDMWERQLSSSVNRASTRAVSKLLEWTSYVFSHPVLGDMGPAEPQTLLQVVDTLDLHGTPASPALPRLRSPCDVSALRRPSFRLEVSQADVVTV